MALTAIQAKNKGPGMHPDGDGLYLNVGKAGNRSWIFRFTSPATGKRREMGIGPFPDVALADAREQAATLRSVVRQGLDPIEQRHAAKAAAEAAAVKAVAEGTTLRQAMTNYLRVKGATWSDKHRTQWAATVLDYFGADVDKPINGLTVERVAEVLAPRWTTTTETAERVLGRIITLCDYALAKKWRSSGAEGWKTYMRNHLPTVPTKDERIENFPALPYADAPAFWQSDLKGSGEAALRFLVLSLGRSSEIRKAKVKEFNLAAGLWVIPPERMKRRREHVVPLPRQAIELVRPLLEGKDPDDLVFDGARKGSPLHDATLTRCIADKWVDYKGDKASVHGFRSTFMDWVGEETDLDIEAADKCLSHAVGNKVRRTYQRGSALNKRAIILQLWADYVSTAEQAGNVVQFKAA